MWGSQPPVPSRRPASGTSSSCLCEVGIFVLFADMKAAHTSRPQVSASPAQLVGSHVLSLNDTFHGFYWVNNDY